MPRRPPVSTPTARRGSSPRRARWISPSIRRGPPGPAQVLDGGFLLPFGGHKGFGLAVLVETLAGVLTGAGIGREVGSLFVDYDRPQNTGHFVIALDLAKFMTAADFRSRREFLVR